jgi:hypothetical protein
VVVLHLGGGGVDLGLTTFHSYDSPAEFFISVKQMLCYNFCHRYTGETLQDFPGLQMFLSLWKVKLSLCLSKNYGMKTYWRRADIVPRILKLGIRWRWWVTLTPRPLYHRGKSPWYPMDRRLSESQCGRSGGEEKKFLCRESNPGCPAHSLAIVPTRYSLQQLVILKTE